MRLVVLILSAAISASLASGQKPLSDNGGKILEKIEANFSGIHDYTVDLDVTVDLERLKVPRMNATMYFKQPNKTHFVSEGFALLPKEGLSFAPASLRSRFEVEAVKYDSALLTLTLKPRNDRTQLRKIFLRVDTTNWTVVQMTTPQFDGRRMDARFEYRTVDDHWLPVQLVVRFVSDTTEVEPPDPFGQFPTAPRPSQLPRTGSITIRYSDYRINSGLKDELFEEEKEK